MKRAIITFHLDSGRSFKVLKSNHKTYYLNCSLGSECQFYLHYNFRRGVWIKSKREVPHNCERNTQIHNKLSKSVEYICGLVEVQNWIKMTGADATTKDLKVRLLSIGISAEYHTLARCLAKLKDQFFITDPNAAMTPKKRGRPKKKIVENQLSTFLLESSSPKQNRRCGNCKQLGHNRRSCSTLALSTI